MVELRTEQDRSGLWRIYGALATASFSQHAGLLFLFVTVPTAMRQEGASLTQVGLFAFVFVPFALQFLWAPLVERRRRSGRVGWRPWLLGTQAALVVGFAALAAIPFGQSTMYALIAVAMALAVAAGTQKIAMGGLAIEGLRDAERAAGNAALGAGSALGSIAGTIGLVWLFTSQGWSTTLLSAALLTAVAGALYGLLPAATSGPPSDATTPPSVLRLFRLAATWRRLAWLLPIALPIGLPFGLIQPRLSDAGLDLRTIGLINGFGQFSVWIIAAPAVTAAIRRLGTARAQRWILLSGGAALACATAVTLVDPSAMWTAVVSSFCAMATLIAVSLVTYTRLMGEAEAGGQAVTEFSVYLSLYGLMILIGAGLSGVVADFAGYAAVLGLAAAGTILAAVFLGTILPTRRLRAGALPAHELS